MDTTAPKMEDEPTHPFVKSMENFNKVFHENWPPRANFENWPPFINIYQEICGQVSKQLATNDEATFS